MKCMKYIVADPGNAILDVSVFPSHVTDSNNNQIPTSLVPFCGFGGNMNTTGKYIDVLTFPVCDKFEAVLRDGRRCYALDMKSVVAAGGGGKTKPGKENSLFIAIDDTTTFNVKQTKSKNEPKVKGRLRPEVKVEEHATTILISLIESYTNSKAGRYKMTSLKKMTGTDSFLALSDETKGCQIEPEEDCNRRRLSEEIQSHCGCLPWIFKQDGFEYVSFVVSLFIPDKYHLTNFF